MNRLYKKSEIWFAISWIIIYVVGTSIADEVSRLMGIEKIISVPYLLILSIIAFVRMKKNGHFAKYGICKTDVGAKSFLFYLPLLLLVSCNFWHGVSINGSWVEFALYGASMFCVGFLEEVIFRGFLFRAMQKDGVKSAVIVSSVTFGIGHIVNLINGSGATLLPNLCQVVSAIAIGFLFVVMVYRGGTLLPCIAAHQFINISSFFANESAMDGTTRIIHSLIICAIAVIYAVVLLKTLPKREE